MAGASFSLASQHRGPLKSLKRSSTPGLAFGGTTFDSGILTLGSASKRLSRSASPVRRRCFGRAGPGKLSTPSRRLNKALKGAPPCPSWPEPGGAGPPCAQADPCHIAQPMDDLSLRRHPSHALSGARPRATLDPGALTRGSAPRASVAAPWLARRRRPPAAPSRRLQ